MGTYAYMDPEYVADGVVGPFTDVYSLGIVFLQLVTGATNTIGLRSTVLQAMEKGTMDLKMDECIRRWPAQVSSEEQGFPASFVSKSVPSLLRIYCVVGIW